MVDCDPGEGKNVMAVLQSVVVNHEAENYSLLSTRIATRAGS